MPRDTLHVEVDGTTVAGRPDETWIHPLKKGLLIELIGEISAGTAAKRVQIKHHNTKRGVRENACWDRLTDLGQWRRCWQ
jgi:hypothetical protein